MIETLFIRADANTQIGSGHLMRCLALAQAWKKQGGNVTFISDCGSESLRNRITGEGFELVLIEKPCPDLADLETTFLVINNSSSIKPWVVLDGYHFDTEYQQRIKYNGNPLLVIDDTAHLNHYFADIILNQNINAENLNYSYEPGTKLLLGTDYVLLRDEFSFYQNWKREIPEVAKKILVTMGAGDANNVTLRVLDALDQVDIDGLKIKVVAGASNPHLDIIRVAAKESRHRVELAIDVLNMSELMAWADLAVSAGGSTCWELAFNGVPSILIVTAENQKSIAEGLNKYNSAVNLGWYNKVTSEQIKNTFHILISDKAKRNIMSNYGRRLINGKGKYKVTAEMNIAI